MQPVLLPAFYPEVAPLTPTLANYLYRRYCRRRQAQSLEAVGARLIRDVSEKRRILTLYFESFVRNQQAALAGKSVPRELQFTTSLILSTIGTYSPDQRPMNTKTWFSWIDRGLVVRPKKGHPELNSAIRVCLLRMLSDEQRFSLPHTIPQEPWYCYAQRSPSAPVESIAINEVEALPPATLVWTPYMGPVLYADGRWKAVGKHQGAISFTGMDEQGYTLSKQDILTWQPRLSQIDVSQSDTSSNDEHTDDERQALAQLALVYLAREKFRGEGE